MGDIAVWGPLVIGAATLVVSAVTLWFVVTDRIRQNRRATHANLSVHTVRSIDIPKEGRCQVLDISNTGGAAAFVLVYSFAEVERLIHPSDSANIGDFTPRFTLTPGQSFSVVIPAETPSNAWVHFLYADTADRRFVHASWTPVFDEYGPAFELTRWEQIKRRITPPRYREQFPVGPGGAPATALKSGPRTQVGIRKSLELLPQGRTVQLQG